jgi:hypothetical protein
MQYERVRDLLLQQWTYTGGPNEARASELYHDDVILEFPQSGEWFGGTPLHHVKIIKFRGDKVERETLYFAEAFPAPDWRRPWAEDGPWPQWQVDLPEHVAGGN